MQYLILFSICLLTYVHQSTADDFDQFRQDVVQQHNLFRKEQCADPLQRNSTVDKIAQTWCDKIIATGQFVHSNTTDYGENSFHQEPYDFSKANGSTPVAYWYQEKVNYTVVHPERALHFTQLVWKNSKMIGVGVGRTPKNGIVVVVNYFPRGNYENQFAQNVGCSN